MNKYFVSYNEIYLILAIGVVVGALLGLIPLLLSRSRNKRRLGWYGFFASMVAGAITPLIAIVVAAVFSWVIVSGAPQTPTGSNESTTTDDSTDSSAE